MIETIKKYNPDSEKYKFGSWAGKYKFGAGIKKIQGQVLEMQIDGQTATAGDWKRWPMIMFGGQKIQNCQQSQYISYSLFVFTNVSAVRIRLHVLVFSRFLISKCSYFFISISIHFTLLKIATTRIIATSTKICFISFLLKNT